MTGQTADAFADLEAAVAMDADSDAAQAAGRSMAGSGRAGEGEVMRPDGEGASVPNATPRPRQTGGLIVTEGIILTFVSGLIGIAVGLFLTWYFFRDGLDFSFAWDEEWSFSGIAMDPVFVPLFRMARVVQSLVFLFLIGTFASLYPAYRATRIDVAEAMKFER